MTTKPDQSYNILRPEDRAIVIASNSVWKVLSNEKVAQIVMREIQKGKGLINRKEEVEDQNSDFDPLDSDLDSQQGEGFYKKGANVVAFKASRAVVEAAEENWRKIQIKREDVATEGLSCLVICLKVT